MADTRGSVLVIDDDPDIRTLVGAALDRAGYGVLDAGNARDGLRLLHARQPDLVVLDVGMPVLDGWATLERIRDMSDVPVVMLTARAGELDRVRGLRGGADDYVPKPFSRVELVARIEAVLRRSGDRGRTETIYDDGRLVVDYEQRTASIDDHELELTPLEFRLLATLARHPNQVLRQDQLLELVWSDAFGTSAHRVKIYVGYLRRKLASRGLPAAIETVRGFGYRFRPST
jgi:DNA-binding response OmpR family regulator